MIEELEELLNECEFESDFVDMENTIRNVIEYVKKLERNYKELSELNSILRFNLRVAEKKTK